MKDAVSPSDVIEIRQTAGQRLYANDDLMGQILKLLPRASVIAVLRTSQSGLPLAAAIIYHTISWDRAESIDADDRYGQIYLNCVRHIRSADRLWLDDIYNSGILSPEQLIGMIDRCPNLASIERIIERETNQKDGWRIVPRFNGPWRGTLDLWTRCSLETRPEELPAIINRLRTSIAEAGFHESNLSLELVVWSDADQSKASLANLPDDVDRLDIRSVDHSVPDVIEMVDARKQYGQKPLTSIRFKEVKTVDIEKLLRSLGADIEVLELPYWNKTGDGLPIDDMSSIFDTVRKFNPRLRALTLGIDWSAGWAADVYLLPLDDGSFGFAERAHFCSESRLREVKLLLSRYDRPSDLALEDIMYIARRLAHRGWLNCHYALAGGGQTVEITDEVKMFQSLTPEQYIKMTDCDLTRFVNSGPTDETVYYKLNIFFDHQGEPLPIAYSGLEIKLEELCDEVNVWNESQRDEYDRLVVCLQAVHYPISKVLLGGQLTRQQLKDRLHMTQEDRDSWMQKAETSEEKAAMLEDMAALLKDEVAELEEKAAKLEDKATMLQEKAAMSEEKATMMEEKAAMLEKELAELKAAMQVSDIAKAARGVWGMGST